MRSALVFLLLLLLLLPLLVRAAAAHEIPADARLHAFVAPEGRTLTLLLRVPLAAMGDVDYPAGPGNTVLPSRADPALRNAVALWILPAVDAWEDGRRLPPPAVAAVRMSLPSDRSFESLGTARAGLARPPPDDALGLLWSQQLLDVRLDYPISSERARFAAEFRVDRFGERVTTGLRFVPPGQGERAFVLHGNAGPVDLDPSWAQAAWRFFQEGVAHILTGTDHLLFLAALVIPFRRLRPLLVIVTAFTLAHSLSLAATVLGWAPDALWFPPLVEALIAATILYAALENVLGATAQRRWQLAFGFGLVHGFGLAFGLQETMQFAGAHLAAALLAFNLGVEAGQVGVLLLLVPVLAFALPRLPSERAGVVVLSALIAHTAWHWMAERWEALAKFPMPKLDVLLLAGLMRGLMAAIVLGALVWGVSGVLNRWVGRVGGR